MKDGFKKRAQAPVRRQMVFSVEVGVAVGMWFRIVFFSPPLTVPHQRCSPCSEFLVHQEMEPVLSIYFPCPVYWKDS